MSFVKDSALAPAGKRKMDWARAFMPTLGEIESSFEQEQPFRGLRIAVSVHLEAKTANLGLALRKGGAQVWMTGSNPLSTQDDIVAALAAMGVETFGVYGASPEVYEAHLTAVLACHPHLVVDDGGDLIHLLGGVCKAYADELIGGCEETTTGIRRLQARERDGVLPCPMVAVNDAKAKQHYDNKYGTGQSVWDAITHTTNLLVAGKTVVVAGYGWCGRGVAMRARGLGARVIVTEVDPIKALEATMENFQILSMEKAAPLGDLFITVTGCKDVITPAHFVHMKDNALLANAGHFDCEVDVAGLAKIAVAVQPQRENIVGYTLENGKTLHVLAEGRLVNLAAGNGHPAEIMDLSFSVQALTLQWLAEQRGKLQNRVYRVPAAIDEQIAWAKLRSMGCAIDKLTEQQQAYLAGWRI